MKAVQPLHELIGLLLSIPEFSMAQNDAELVPAKPADDVRLAKMITDHGANLPQDFIAGGMTEVIVHLLEPVKIKINETERRSMPVSERDLTVQFPFEGPPVENRAEGIVIGQTLSLVQRLPQAGLLGPQVQHLFCEGPERRHRRQVMPGWMNIERCQQVIRVRTRPRRYVSLPIIVPRLAHEDIYTSP